MFAQETRDEHSDFYTIDGYVVVTSQPIIAGVGRAYGCSVWIRQSLPTLDGSDIVVEENDIERLLIK